MAVVKKLSSLSHTQNFSQSCVTRNFCGATCAHHRVFLVVNDVKKKPNIHFCNSIKINKIKEKKQNFLT